MLALPLTCAPSFIAALLAAVPSDDLAPRVPLPARPVVAVALPPDAPAHAAHRLIVKFADGARARLDARGALVATGATPVDAALALAAEEGLAFAPLIGLAPARIDALLARAAERTGRAQPDLLGLFAVAADADPARLEALGAALQALPEVEFAYVQLLGEEPPGDFAPPTPNLAANQGYAGPNPGIDVDFAVSIGADGTGVRIADCEYGWMYGHEDLVDVDLHPEPGQTPVPDVAALGWDDHGTAALGELAAADNGYGCTGLTLGCEFATYPEWTLEGGFRRVECIAAAIADSDVGDVVLLEMQTSAGLFGGYVPAEYDPAVFVVVKAGVDAGVVVVGAAGNGDVNLDAPAYAGYAALGDSGAILVGAGSADVAHDKLAFSTYGDRVDLQGWGASVFTLGYGSHASYGGDPLQSYAFDFSGTSSASPIVAAAVAALQGEALSELGAPLTSQALRALLEATGIPQGAGGKIGPLPDLGAALGALLGDPTVGVGGGIAGAGGVPTLAVTGLGWAGTSVGVDLSGGAASAALIQVIGGSRVDLPLVGGTLIPSPDLITAGLATDAAGAYSTSLAIPAGIAPGVQFWIQYWLTDGAAPAGWSATDGRELTVL